MSELVAQSEIVEQAVSYAESAKTRLIHALESVPDDKLTWSPSPTAKTPLAIAAHAGMSNSNFASLLRGDPMPDLPFEKLMAMMAEAENAIKTREEAVQIIEVKSAEAIAALNGLTQARIGEEVQTPFGSMSVKFIMTIIGRHMDSHAAQIDYLQTIWGDQQMHF